MLHHYAMFGDAKGMIARCLPVPARYARQPASYILNLNIKGRGVKQIKTAAREHALPCTFGGDRVFRHFY